MHHAYVSPGLKLPSVSLLLFQKTSTSKVEYKNNFEFVEGCYDLDPLGVLTAGVDSWISGYEMR